MLDRARDQLAVCMPTDQDANVASAVNIGGQQHRFVPKCENITLTNTGPTWVEVGTERNVSNPQRAHPTGVCAGTHPRGTENEGGIAQFHAESKKEKRKIRQGGLWKRFSPLNRR